MSHFDEHKFKHSFQDLISLACNCGYKVESRIHCFLHSPLIINKNIPISTLHNLDSKLFENIDSLLTNILVFGSDHATILNATIESLLSTKRFDVPLFIS